MIFIRAFADHEGRASKGVNHGKTYFESGDPRRHRKGEGKEN
jgi:hypothetical protein